MIDQIETSTGDSSGNNNEVDLSRSYLFNESNKCIIIFPYYNYEGSVEFKSIKETPILEYTLTNHETYVYIGVFNNSEEKAEISVALSYDGDESYKYSGLININKPKVFVIKGYNEKSSQNPVN